ncbi:MAG: hypothetical protein ACYDEA_03765 [Candidatus Dormibacteria bacterium]
MWSSPVRRRPTRILALAASLLAGGSLLTACASTAAAPRLALEGFLVDMHAHSVVYAYTLLSNPAEAQTPFLPFFNGVNASKANYRVVGMKVINSNEVVGTVAVSSPGAATTYVQVQMLQEGNAGDWLVSAPFTTDGARAIRLFQ